MSLYGITSTSISTYLFHRSSSLLLPFRLKHYSRHLLSFCIRSRKSPSYRLLNVGHLVSHSFFSFFFFSSLPFFQSFVISIIPSFLLSFHFLAKFSLWMASIRISGEHTRLPNIVQPYRENKRRNES